MIDLATMPGERRRASGVVLAAFFAVWASPAWSGSVWVGSFAKSTVAAPTVQVVAHGLGEVPKALILWTGADGVPSPGISHGFGMSDGITSMAAATSSAPAVASPVTARRMAPVLLTLIDTAGASVAEATLLGWDRTSFSLKWEINDASSPAVHVIAIGGSEVSARLVPWTMQSGTTGLQSISGLGFRPSVVLNAHLGAAFQSAPPASAVGAAFGLGVMDLWGHEWTVDFYSHNGGANTDTQRYQSSSAAVAGIANDLSVAKQASFVSMDSDGFTLNWTEIDAAATRSFALALSGVDVWAGSFTSSVAAPPANQSVSGIPFRPAALLFASSQDAGSAVPVANSRMLLGAAAASGQASTVLDDGDSLPVSAPRARDATGAVYTRIESVAGDVVAQAVLSSFDSAGFTLAWTTNDQQATTIAYLALAPRYLATHVPDPIAPAALAEGDLNGDGRGDLVVVHRDQGEVSVLLAGSGGAWSPARHFTLGFAPSAVAVGDINGDGKNDVVVAGSDATGGGSGRGRVAVLSGDGAGGLGTTRSFAVGEGPIALVLLDLNRDGQLDVATADAPMNGLVLLEGDGAGSLVETGFIATGPGPSGLAVGDLNADGAPDLVAAEPGAGGAAVSLGDGIGGFSPSSFIAVGSGPMGVALGDFDADGHTDAVFADEPAGQVVVLLGDGTGGFGAPAAFSTGSGPIAVVVGTFDDDCALDLASANAASGDITVLAGDGIGGLGAPSAFAVGGAPSGLVALASSGGERSRLAGTVAANDDIVILGDDDFSRLGVAADLAYTGCDQANVSFTPRVTTTSGGGGVGGASYVWDFGDGSPALSFPTATAVQHAYAQLGGYAASLTVVDALGRCLVTRLAPVYLAPAVTARLGGPYRQCVEQVPGAVASFMLDGTASSTPRPGGWMQSIAWSVAGAGVTLISAGNLTATLQVPVSLAPIAVPVTLSVVESSGCTASETVMVELRRVPPPAPSAAPATICAGKSSLLDAGPGHTAYHWSTGQTTQSIVVSPSTPTSYDVDVYDDAGCTARGTVAVTVLSDAPVTVAVSQLTLAKGTGGSVVVSYADVGAPGYNLHRAASADGLGQAPQVAHVDGALPFTDTPPAGPLYYAVRGATACSKASGP